MKLAETAIEPVRKTRRVGLTSEEAFELFTRRLETWWPLSDHSVAGNDAVGVVFEERVGGRVLEKTRSGEVHSWADVFEWDPPHRFLLSWHPSATPVAASILEVVFEPAGSDHTVVTLEHRGWEALGEEKARTLRDRYDSGWEGVLDRFQESVGSAL